MLRRGEGRAAIACNGCAVFSVLRGTDFPAPPVFSAAAGGGGGERTARRAGLVSCRCSAGGEWGREAFQRVPPVPSTVPARGAGTRPAGFPFLSGDPPAPEGPVGRHGRGHARGSLFCISFLLIIIIFFLLPPHRTITRRMEMALRGFCVGLPAEPGLPHHHGAAIRPCAQRVSPCEAPAKQRDGAARPRSAAGHSAGEGAARSSTLCFSLSRISKAIALRVVQGKKKKSRLKTVVFNLRDRSVWPAAVVSYLYLIVCHRNGGECEV